MRSVFTKLKKKIIRSWSIGSLGASVTQRIKIFSLLLLHSFLVHAGITRPVSFSLRIVFGGINLTLYFPSIADLYLLEEIFMHKIYTINSTVHQPKTIFDLGGNIGISALFFSICFPKAVIHVFEPDPATFLILEKNITGREHMYAHNFAIADTDGVVDFYTHKTNRQSSSLFPRGNSIKISVSAKTLETVVRDLDIQCVDLLKFDIEGAEFALFKNLPPQFRAGVIIGEVHQLLTGKSAEALASYFEGYTVEYDRDVSKDKVIFRAVITK